MQKYQVVLNSGEFRYGDMPTLDPADPVVDAKVKAGILVPVPDPFDPTAEPVEMSESEPEVDPQGEGEAEVQAGDKTTEPEAAEPEPEPQVEPEADAPEPKAPAKPRGHATKKA